MFSFTARHLKDTDRLGVAIAAAVPDGVTIVLTGTLGAGKTRLVQAIAAACGIKPQDVVSPTFVLCQEYNGRRRIVHLDAYRIADDDEFLQLGVDEHFDSDAIVLIEWGERVVSCLPVDHLTIEISVTGESDRIFQVSGEGASAVQICSNLERQLGEAAN